MLRIVQSSAAAGAKSYYRGSDYYLDGQEMDGIWGGTGAARLGLNGTVQRKEWDALCDNRHPATGKTLTPRQKDNRRVGYDFNFHVPKSVSILYGMTGDARILDAFRESVSATMQDMETEMKTRVRSKGRDEDRTTGNMVWGEFVHFTARPVNGVPDPHLHAHCFVFNNTWDSEESRWKAGQFADLKRDAPYFEAVFHARLARRLAELGLPIERTRKGWELQGTPTAAIRQFSRRTALIEEKAAAGGITDPDAKGALGAKTRERKAPELSLAELRQDWNHRLGEDGRYAIAAMAQTIGGHAIPEDLQAARVAVQRGIDHSFERSSVLPERKVLTEALKRAVGAASPETVAELFNHAPLLRADRDGARMVTPRGVLREEKDMIAFARDGRGACRPVTTIPHSFKRTWLNPGQRRAVEHVLHSRDRVILIRGAAGTGKTSMMQEAVEAIEATGKHVFTFAPSADAARGVLRQEGFATADTVARLLKDEKMQAQLAHQVIWIDEAGLLGGRAMAQVFELADRHDSRVILSGDRKQHGSVERGAALRLLEEEAGVVPAEIREIKRQRGDYRQAVKALSEGRTEAGFRELDRLGWIREIGHGDRYKTLAEEYLSTIREGKTALVVSPTHLEGEWITDEVRARMKQTGRLGPDERRFTVLESANLTQAEREDRVSYGPGDVLVFHQNAKGFLKGQRLGAESEVLPLDQAGRFQVFHTGTLPIAAGDVLRITRNGTTADGRHRLNNGALFTVKEFNEHGDIVLANGWTIDKEYGHLAHGYVVTSQASQGKTVDRVIIGASSVSSPAASREGFYVSVSRGKERATIYCDDKAALLEAVSRSDDRLSATELLSQRGLRHRLARALGWARPNTLPERRPGPSVQPNREVTYDR